MSEHEDWTLERHMYEELKNINAQLLNLHIAVASLKVKAGVWGLLGGAVPVIIGVGLYIFKKEL